MKKNAAGKGRKTASPTGKQERNAAPQKRNPARKSTNWSTEKQSSKEKVLPEDGRKMNNASSGQADQKSRPGSGNASRQESDTGGKAARPDERTRQGKSSFKSYRQKHKNKAGGETGERRAGVNGRDERKGAGAPVSKSKGNPKRDAFSKRQSGPAKVAGFKKDEVEKNVNDKERPATYKSRLPKKGRAKPAGDKRKTFKGAQKAAGKAAARPGSKTASTKKRR